MPPPAVQNSFLFEIAGIPAEFTSNSEEILREIPELWAKFCGNRPPQLKIHLTHLPKGVVSRAHPKFLKWDPDGFHISVWGMEARYDEGRGEAELVLPKKGGWGDILRLFYSLYLVKKGGVLLHGNAIEKNGQVSIFSGPSESGKTTIARLRGERNLLTDESVALLPGPDGKTYAYSTPFFGELFYVTKNLRVPVSNLFYIFHGKEYACYPMGEPEALKHFFHNIFQYVLEASFCRDLLENLSRMVKTFRSHKFFFLPEERLWDYLRAELKHDL